MIERLLAILFSDNAREQMKEIGQRFLSRRQWPHDRLEFWFRLLVEKLSRTFRWHTFYATLPEHVLGHMLKQTLTTATLASLEGAHGNRGLTMADAHFVIAAASLHDIGEAEAQDFPRPMKEDPSVGPMLKKIEGERLKDVISFLPPETRGFILACLARVEDKSTLIGRFFDACEWVGYLIFALEEVTRGNRAFLDVIANSLRSLHERGYVRDFVSVRMLLEAHGEKILKVFTDNGLTLPDDPSAPSHC